MCERTGHNVDDQARSCLVTSHLARCFDATSLLLLARRPSKKALLLPSPLAPRWLWALLPKGEFQHAAARLPRPTASPVEKSTPDVVAGACASLLRSAHLPMNRRCCSALTERGPFFRALHRMHRRLSCRKSTPDAAAAFAGSKRLRASCVRTCWMRWTSTRRRSLSHCASGGIRCEHGQPTFLRSDHSPIDPRSASPSDGSFGSDRAVCP